MVSTGSDRATALALLGLPAAATRDQIVAAYRRLARTTHPDLSDDADAAERFIALTTAYRNALTQAEQASPAQVRQDWWLRPHPRRPAAADTVIFAAGPAWITPYQPRRQPAQPEDRRP